MKYFCPACHSERVEWMFDMGYQPLSLVALTSDPSDSAMESRHRIDLYICHHCGHVHNGEFDSTVDQYSGAGCRMYNNGVLWQDHMDYMRGLVESFSVNTIVEIGAGDCSFLGSLDTEAVKIAIDPCEAVLKASKYPKMFYRRRYFDAKQDIRPEYGDTVIVMRHLLEHMVSPRQFLEDIVFPARRRTSTTTLIIEVPGCDVALENCRIEDWTFEHPQHFTLASLMTLLRSVGIECQSVQQAYGREVLIAVGHIFPPSLTDAPDTDTIICNYDRADKSVMKGVDWLIANNSNIAFWGGAGKSAMFLNRFLVNESSLVVDSHDEKWGMCVPGTKIKMHPPSILLDKPARTIIATTSWRADDIAREIKDNNIPCAKLLKFEGGQFVEVPLG